MMFPLSAKERDALVVALSSKFPQLFVVYDSRLYINLARVDVVKKLKLVKVYERPNFGIFRLGSLLVSLDDTPYPIQTKVVLLAATNADSSRVHKMFLKEAPLFDAKRPEGKRVSYSPSTSENTTILNLFFDCEDEETLKEFLEKYTVDTDGNEIKLNFGKGLKGSVFPNPFGASLEFL